MTLTTTVPHTRPETPVDRTRLEQTLRRVSPAARLVKDRHYQRALQRLEEQGERVCPSADWPLWIERAKVEAIAAFPAAVTAGREDELLLLPEPTGRMPDADVLRACWRQLFRATVFRTLSRTAGRWRQLDETVRVEAEFYLTGDGLLPPNPTDAEKYAAFAAEFVALFRFDPAMLRYTFPVADATRVLSVLRTDLDDEAVFDATRLEDAAAPEETELSHGEVVAPAVPTQPEPAGPLLAKAARAGRVRNDVRAAILLAKAAEALPEHEAAARAVVASKLVPRLAGVFGWDAAVQEKWTAALVPLLHPAGRSYWSAAATALYELQMLAIDLSADLYTVDPAGWARSLGRKPVLRKLALARRSVLLQGLRSVSKRLASVPLEVRQREAVETLLNAEIGAAEAELRSGVEPVLRNALQAAGLVPANIPETVGRDKLVAELVDLLCEKGHIRLADLRDAIARNRLKLPDLSGVGEWFRGDTLLRADALLSDELDGLYHRGEIYLRLIQRASAAAFGSRFGRAVTLYFLLPFAAAVMVVEFSKYMAHEARVVYKFVSRLVRTADEPPAITAVEEAAEVVAGGGAEAAEAVQATAAVTGAVPHAAHAHAHGPLVTPGSAVAVLILAVFFLGLIHSPAFRSVCLRLIRWLGSALKWVFVTAPLWVWRSPPARAVRSNVVTRFVVDRFGWACVAAAAVMAFLFVFGASIGRVERWTAITFGLVALALNTPFGRRWQDGCEEVIARGWRTLWGDVLPGLVSFLAWVFRELLGAVDRWLYTIDEWFRFRAGDSKPSLALKVVLGVVWFPIAYVVRFAFYLLIEPQVNPLKHFPVVTVSHKLLLPMIPSLAQSTGFSLEAVGAVVSGIPGIFGFMVWELKENWRLYAANRPADLTAVSLGHHGETVRGLLRPGFHSGTVPSAFRKVRKAVVKAERRGRVADVSKPVDALHHVEHAVTHFAERELFAVLETAACWRGLHAEVGAVRLGLQDIDIDVRVPALSPDPVRIGFALIADEVRCQPGDGGFLEHLTAEQREVWDRAVTGLSAMGATGRVVNWQEWVAFWEERKEQPDHDVPVTPARAPGITATR